jgi:hypothetical protein
MDMASTASLVRCQPPGAQYERHEGATHPKGFEHAQCNGRRVPPRRGRGPRHRLHPRFPRPRRSRVAPVCPPGRQPVPAASARLRPRERDAVLSGAAGLECGVRAQPCDLRMDYARGVGIQKPRVPFRGTIAGGSVSACPSKRTGILLWQPSSRSARTNLRANSIGSLLRRIPVRRSASRCHHRRDVRPAGPGGRGAIQPVGSGQPVTAAELAWSSAG